MQTGNIRPTITLNAIPYNVTVGMNSTLLANITDPDSNTTYIWLTESIPVGSYFDNITGDFFWNPIDTSQVNLT